MRRLAPLIAGGGASLLFAGFVACSSSSPTTSTPEDAGADVTFDAPNVDAAGDGPISTGSVELQVLALSDWRGQLEPVVEKDTNGLPQPYGGLEALSAFFAAERAQQPNTLVVATGDTFGATPVLASHLGDVPVAAGLDLLGASADTFGEHDFAGGYQGLAALLGATKTPFVSTNLTSLVGDVEAGALGPKPVTPFLSVVVGQGVDKAKIAILGVTNADLPNLQFAPQLGGVGLDTKGPLVAANDAAAAARLLGADVVIALAHIGAARDGASGPLFDFAKQLVGVDVVFGGQTDVAVSTAVTTTSGATVLVVQNRNKGRTYARVRLSVSNGQLTKPADVKIIDPQVTQVVTPVCEAGAPAEAGCGCPAAPCPSTSYVCDLATSLCQKDLVTLDKDAGALMKTWGASVGSYLDTKVAVASDAFVADGSEGVKETTLGDLTCDAFLDKYKPAFGAQIALVSAGRLRASLPSSYVPSAGGLQRGSAPYDLVLGDTHAAFPLGDTVVLRKVRGQLLWQALEHALAQVPARASAFLQVAGLRVTYSLGADAGSRVKAVVLEDGAAAIPPDDATEYTVAMTDFMSAGGDGYAMLVEAPPAAPTPGRDLVTDVVADYVKSKTPVAPVTTFTRIVQVP